MELIDTIAIIIFILVIFGNLFIFMGSKGLASIKDSEEKTETIHATNSAHPVEEEYAGYVNSINVGGKLYKIKAEVVESRAITCSHCGAPLELHHGKGKCPYCDTHYSTNIFVEGS